MRLSRYTDYALRVLMHVAVKEDRPSSIPEIARAYAISSDHLGKIVHDLGKAGYITTRRGRGGGIRLARTPAHINLGDVVRHTEDGFNLVPCPECVIVSACTLPRILDEAVGAFLACLDKYTLADLLVRREILGDLLAISGPLQDDSVRMT
ncbi:Rrf2 family transcriptional regulator [Sphingosinicellaceae bacterium]|nr:Rrf2 family transcriptional regulator [Sphingosinicellaceae bacterium]